MKLRLLFLLLVSLLLPGLCLAAPKKKPTIKDSRSLKAVAKVDGRRVALVIGNGAYRYTDSMPKLANPANDADDIAAALRGFGFDVIAKKNLTKQQMDEAIIEFGRKATNSDAALFYFAGHGLQVKGQNYLVPVDAKIEAESQVQYNALNVNQLLDELDSSKSKVNIVMLDACRNNPISGKFRSGGTRGLAPPASSPKGTVIVYATDPGNVAADGSGRNGLFTSGLLTALRGNDLTLGGVLVKASEVVEAGSNRSQTPYVNGPPSVQKNFSFAPGQSTLPDNNEQVAMAPRPQQPPASVKNSNSLDDIIADTESAERAKKERAEKIKADVAKYKKIVAARPEMKQQAWDALVTSYPEAGSVPTGNISAFMKATGMSDNDPTTGMEFVTVPQGFRIGKYEVTQGQWRKVMESNPSHFSRCGDNCPVEKVSWNDAQQFISKLNSMSGANYRLPTEAEWEYACRAGENHQYCGSNNIDSVAWYKDNSGSQTNPAGQKQANGWGIHDMSGNVWEWCQDSKDSKRVYRGGSWNNGPSYVQASTRDGYSPGYRINDLGFRLLSPIQ